MPGLSGRCSWRIVVAICAICAGLPAFARAETVLSGGLTDPQGKAVAGATVRLLLPSGDLVAETRTGSIGRFSFRNIAPGEYRVSASAPGFAPINRDVSLPEAQTAGADLQF